jgi:hypothetical protein
MLNFRTKIQIVHLLARRYQVPKLTHFDFSLLLLLSHYWTHFPCSVWEAKIDLQQVAYKTWWVPRSQISMGAIYLECE